MSDAPQINGPLAPADGRFKPGNRVGGRKRGSRNKATLFWQSLESNAQDDVKAIIGKMVELAKAGDCKAADIVLSRFMPAPKNRKLPVNLPNITDSAGLAAAYQATARALSTGVIDPDEATKVAALLEAQRRNLEGSDINQRLKLVEDRLRTGDHA